MGILSDESIKAAIRDGLIKARHLAPNAVGTNSIDLHLSRHIAVYVGPVCLCTNEERQISRGEIGPEGLELLPGDLYLGSTVEWIDAGPFVPMLEGTSSAGRLGISVHATAGVGDVGFAGHWTLEISVVRPVRVFGGEPVAQIILHTVEGNVGVPYRSKPGANYRGDDPRPMPSCLWKKRRWLGLDAGRPPELQTGTHATPICSDRERGREIDVWLIDEPGADRVYTSTVPPRYECSRGGTMYRVRVVLPPRPGSGEIEFVGKAERVDG